MKLTKVKGFYPYMAVVFANSFVDLGHKVLIQDTLYQTTSGEYFTVLSSIINALILLPYILLFTPSGFIADKFSKAKVLRLTAAAAIPLTVMITWCYYMGYFWGAYSLTFLLGVQSAINSPAKYGYIKELFGKEHLAAANAWLQTLVIISILSSTLVFTVLFSKSLSIAGISDSQHQAAILQAFAPIGFLLVIFSIIETVLTYRLPVFAAVDAHSQYEIQNYFKGRYAKNYLNSVATRPAILTCILALSVLWAVNQVLLASYGAYAKEYLHNASIIFVQGSMALAGIGILLGAAYAGRVSRGFIETGIIPIGTIGIAIGLFFLPHLSNQLLICLLFLIYGFFCGIVVVPLNALIQFNAGKSELGKVLAASNFLQNVMMLSFLFITAFASYIGMSSSYLIYSLFIIAAIASVYSIKKLPQSLIRYALYSIVSKFYRLKVDGLDNLPSQGGVLLLGNHVSYIDWALLQIASPRPIRFVMDKTIYEKWYLNWFLRQFNLIPIARGDSKQALKSISEGLNKGDIIGLFPEGRLSVSGQLGKFHTGFERAAAKANAVIIPFYLQGIWGSKTSHASKMQKRNHNRHIIISFGKQMAIDSTAEQVKQHVKELAFVCWHSLAESYTSIAHAWVNIARKNPSRKAIADANRTSLTQRQLLTRVINMRAGLKPLAGHKNIGMLLPSNCQGITALLSCLCLGNKITLLNPDYALETQIEQSEIDAIVTTKALSQQLTKHLAHLEKNSIVYCDELDSKMTKKPSWFIKWISYLPSKLIQAMLVKKTSTQTSTISCFNGQQFIPQSQSLLIRQCKQFASVLHLNSRDVMVNCDGLHAISSLTLTTLLPLLEACPLVLCPRDLASEKAGKLFFHHHVSVMITTAEKLQQFTGDDNLIAAWLQSLRLVISYDRNLSSANIEAFKQKFNCDIFQAFGLDGVGAIISCNLPDSVSPSDYHVHRGNKADTQGEAIPGYALRIVDNDHQTLASNQVGQLYTQLTSRCDFYFLKVVINSTRQ